MENNGNKRTFVVIDEIQNMIQSDASAVIKVLSQGREKGLAMITATQSFLSIPKKFKSMFLQSGVNVFFQPEITAADLIAKQICAGNNWQQVSSALKKLEIAECLVYGSMENHQHQMEPDTLLYCNCNLDLCPCMSLKLFPAFSGTLTGVLPCLNQSGTPDASM